MQAYTKDFRDKNTFQCEFPRKLRRKVPGLGNMDFLGSSNKDFLYKQRLSMSISFIDRGFRTSAINEDFQKGLPP